MNESIPSGATVSAQQLLTIFNQSDHLALVTLSETLTILTLSPNLPIVIQRPNLPDYRDQPLTALFGEFVGAEAGMTAVLQGNQPFFQFENVAHTTTAGEFCYLTLTLFPITEAAKEAKLLLLIENVTPIGRLQQRLTHQRNLLRQEVARRQAAEEALQKLNQELEERVAERTAALTEANRQLRLLEAAIANTTDTVIITEAQPQALNQDGIVYVNDAFSKATGYSYQEIVGQSRQMFYGPNTDTQQLDKIRDALLNQQSVQVELINYRKDGTEFWVDMTIAPINTENGHVTHYVSIERDATERKQLEDALLQAQKMEAIGLLAGGIAHDFNNMLTVVNSYSDLLLRRFQDDQAAVRYIQPIFTASQRAAELTAKLLAFSRRQMLSIEPVNLNQIVQDVLYLIQRPIGEDIQFTTLLTPHLWTIHGDAGQLSQVLLNLIMNARESMHNGGMIVIETENVNLTGTESQLTPSLSAGRYAKLAVSDTGSGIANQHLSKIFDPFFTTKEIGKGTGLGLSTALGIIAQLGGGIAVHSHIEQGTTFEIFLPAKHNAAHHLLEAQPTEQPKATILLVEDDEEVRMLLHEGLQLEGYKILQAANGEKAQAIFEQYPHVIDLLLTDIVMPGVDGFALADRLSAQQPTLAVLFITGYSKSLLAERGLQENENILSKPFTIDKLLNAVAKALGNEAEKK